MIQKHPEPYGTPLPPVMKQICHRQAHVILGVGVDMIVREASLLDNQ